jgi:hypothetical protein
MKAPEAYRFSPAHPKLPRQLVLRVGYVEDAFEVRTPLAGFFSILLSTSRFCRNPVGVLRGLVRMAGEPFF